MTSKLHYDHIPYGTLIHARDPNRYLFVLDLIKAPSPFYNIIVISYIDIRIIQIWYALMSIDNQNELKNRQLSRAHRADICSKIIRDSWNGTKYSQPIQVLVRDLASKELVKLAKFNQGYGKN